MKQPDSYFEMAEFVSKFLNGALTPEECVRLKVWIDESEEHEKIWQQLINPEYLEEHLLYWKDRSKEAYWKQLELEIFHKKKPPKVAPWKIIRIAAVVIPFIFIFGAGWFLVRQQEIETKPDKAEDLVGVNIMPRGKVAQLVLGNGKIVNLNDSMRQSITEGDGTSVRNQESVLTYVPGSRRDNPKTIYNTLVTPRGGEYQVTLSDGTIVWLNAASSLRFPTSFHGQERKVYLSGEAYFEVASDEQHPFMVDAGNMGITVLGTKFNVTAYGEDPGQKATLAEGSVRIQENNHPHSTGQAMVLKPGFEAIMEINNPAIRVHKANVESALAWKNGLFLFEGESLENILRTLSRWYDVDVVYDDDVNRSFHFTGRIQKYGNISGILHLLTLTGKVKFNMMGRKLEVIPQ